VHRYATLESYILYEDVMQGYMQASSVEHLRKRLLLITAQKFESPDLLRNNLLRSFLTQNDKL